MSVHFFPKRSIISVCSILFCKKVKKLVVSMIFYFVEKCSGVRGRSPPDAGALFNFSNKFSIANKEFIVIFWKISFFLFEFYFAPHLEEAEASASEPSRIF